MDIFITFIYPFQDRQSMNKIIKNVSEVEVGQTIGFTWTANNDAYRTYGQIVSKNGNTIKIKSELDVRGYQKDQIFTYSFRKSTKWNHVFIFEGADEIVSFNKSQGDYRQKLEAKINEYWIKRIEKADQERKEQGVYLESETFNINFETGRLEPIADSKRYGISV